MFPSSAAPSEDVWLCATCGVEHAVTEGACRICADERQWMPAGGQKWTSLETLRREGHAVEGVELEPGLLGLTVSPTIGIGQQAHLISTPAGSLLWDVPPFIDAAAVDRVRARGRVLAIAASHPHMFGVQSQWSRALGGVPILVCEPQLDWVGRPDPAITPWRGYHELAPGLALHELGGHFTGSSVVHWADGAEGRGVLLISDTIHGNPDRATVTFMRSYPNRIPLSPTVVERLAGAVAPLAFDRTYDNFGRCIEHGADAAIRHSADRYIGWARGDFDELT